MVIKEEVGRTSQRRSEFWGYAPQTSRTRTDVPLFGQAHESGELTSHKKTRRMQPVGEGLAISGQGIITLLLLQEGARREKAAPVGREQDEGAGCVRVCVCWLVSAMCSHVDVFPSSVPVSPMSPALPSLVPFSSIARADIRHPTPRTQRHTKTPRRPPFPSSASSRSWLMAHCEHRAPRHSPTRLPTL